MEDGVSLRDHYENAWRITGRKPPELDQPPLNPLVSYIWGWFIDLHGHRGSTGFGPAAISYRNISEWATLLGYKPKRWEINALCSIDRLYLAESQKQSK